MKHIGNSALPEGGKARRVYLLLRDDITSGRFKAGSVLPGEQRLSAIHGVSRVTIRRALETLVADGLIEKRPGAGSVVREDRAGAAIAADMASPIPQVVQMGQSTTARLLSFSYGEAPAAVSAELGLSDGERVQTAIRVRSYEGAAFSHLTTYVPERIAVNYSEADLASTALFTLLERSGVAVDSAAQRVSATLAAPDVAQALDVSVGSALLSLTRTVRDADGKGVEYLSALYRPDMFKLEMQLARVGRDSARHWEPIIVAPVGERPE